MNPAIKDDRLTGNENAGGDAWPKGGFSVEHLLTRQRADIIYTVGMGVLDDLWQTVSLLPVPRHQ